MCKHYFVFHSTWPITILYNITCTLYLLDVSLLCTGIWFVSFFSPAIDRNIGKVQEQCPCRGQFLSSRSNCSRESRMNPQFCSPLPLRPSFVPVVVRPTVPVWYTSLTQDHSSPTHGVPLFPFGLTPEANFNSQTTIGVDHSKGNENLC